MAMMKKVKLLSLLLIGLIAVPVTSAYYSNSASVDNEFETIHGVGVGIEENFKANDTWLPGEKRQKEVWFTNPSNTPVLIRMKYIEGWYSEETLLNDYDVGNVSKKWTDAFRSEWIHIGDYYYYTKVLNGKNQTNRILDEIALAPVSNDEQGKDYSDKNYKLEFIVEGSRVDSDAVETLFNVNATIDGENVNWQER